MAVTFHAPTVVATQERWLAFREVQPVGSPFQVHERLPFPPVAFDQSASVWPTSRVEGTAWTAATRTGCP